MRQYGREDVEYEAWYSDWAKTLATRYSRAEIETQLGITQAELSRSTHAHEAAIKATASMSGCSQRRAQARNCVAAAGEYRLALKGALEIHELFPEFAKR